ncbi:reverse transcriptase domain-containing protein [Citrus sinensis]|uniref:Reverse transcriptase domain-containing protein n=1 Tax=Citrus sinensis TaxID=2711 RepID=A0ACB8MT01_CITSI|nr:reverse transcriptase domain-containing protein [Citrus sinensis]
MEPRISGRKADDFIRSSGFEYSHRVEAVGFAGGIWLLWQNVIEVEVRLNHKQFIHFKISKNKNFVSWITAVYASPNPMVRKQLWNHLDSLALSVKEPWLIGGDFNSILYASEKQGGAAGQSRGCGLFRQWFDDNQIFDLKFKGPRFTWSRGFLLKRLDRALCNNEWLLKFTDNSVLHLPKVASDHRPVLVRFGRIVRGHHANRPFRFLASWLTNDQFNNFVKQTWDPKASYSDAASNFVKEVKVWNREVFGNIFQRKRVLMARINEIQAALENYSSRGLMRLEAQLRKELETVMGQEEILWWQKSRKDWIMHGDRNTRFFHQKTIVRRRRNRIEAIQDSSGNWLYNEEEIRNHAMGFVPGRHIIDNIVVAQEVVHSMRRKTGKRGLMAIKVDLEKAYDRLNWSFIFETLQLAGFPIQLSRLIMECVTTVKMSILWNGEVTEEFSPGRGIRQGDPLSPYIFVLCIERLSHEASVDQAYIIDEVLENYCRSSEAKVNKSKTKVFFSKNVSIRDGQLIGDALGFSATKDLATYQSILDKVNMRLTGWNAAHLSFAGRNKSKLASHIPWECVFGVAVWRLWFWRNHFMVEGKLVDSSAIIMDVMARANEIHRINFSHMRAGGVIRDYVGNWISGFCMNIGECTVAMAELWGLYQGLILAWEAGIKWLLVEVDSLYVTQMISKQVVVPNVSYALVVAIWDLLDRNWQVCLTHIYREANSVADFMANMALSLPNGMHFFTSPPVGIYSVILQDMIGVAKPRIVPI